MVLPGPPREFKSMVTQEVIPRVVKLMPDKQVVDNLVMHYCGIPESQLMESIGSALSTFPDVVATSYVQPAEIQVRLTLRATNQQEAAARLRQARDAVVSHLPEGYFGDGTISLAGQVVKLLKEKQLHVTAAESLTGGLLQSMICSIPGASAVFDGGFVTYAPQQKEKLLNIDRQVIDKYGVVSAETAGAMADGCRTRIGADFGIGLTGVAGPDPLEGQPAGTVWLGLSENDEPTATKRLQLRSHAGRQAIRIQSAQAALMMLYQRLKK